MATPTRIPVYPRKRNHRPIPIPTITPPTPPAPAPAVVQAPAPPPSVVIPEEKPKPPYIPTPLRKPFIALPHKPPAAIPSTYVGPDRPETNPGKVIPGGYSEAAVAVGVTLLPVIKSQPLPPEQMGAKTTTIKMSPTVMAEASPRAMPSVSKAYTYAKITDGPATAIRSGVFPQVSAARKPSIVDDFFKMINSLFGGK